MDSKQHQKLRAGVACFGFIALLAGDVFASSDTVATTTVAMDKVRWLETSDRFHCKLELPLKRIGAVAFQQYAGEPLQLIYTPTNPYSGNAYVAAITPPWQPHAQSQFEQLAAGSGGGLELPTPQASALLRSMDQGLWTLIKVDRKEIVIPTIRWDDASAAFHACRKTLSPLSIKQARDLTLYYQSGQRALSHEQLNQLETLGQYLKIDSKVARVLIDAYTDDNGSRTANLQISRERAADVAAALKSGGVSGEIIEQRAHGDRYPSADNSTPEGRNLNRKVTVRVIRKDG